MKILTGIPRWGVWLVVGLLVPVALSLSGFGQRSFMDAWLMGLARVEAPPQVFNATGSARNQQELARDLLSARLQRMVAIEELVPRVDSDPDGVYLYPSMTWDWAESDVEMAVEQLRTSRVTDQNVRVGVFAVPSQFGLPEGVGGGFRRGSDVMVLENAGDPVCLRVVKSERDLQDGTPVVKQGPRPLNSRTLRSRMGLCHWVARYGVPGPEIWKWLDAHGQPDAATDLSDSGVLALNRYQRVSSAMDARSCAAGTLARCALFWDASVQIAGSARARSAWDLVLSSDRDLGLVANEQGLRTEVFWGGNLWGVRLLPSLERELGAEAFEAFWTSQQAPADAFTAAAGVPADEWVREQVRAAGLATTVSRAGVSLWSLFALLSTAALGLLVGARAAGRREMG